MTYQYRYTALPISASYERALTVKNNQGATESMGKYHVEIPVQWPETVVRWETEPTRAGYRHHILPVLPVLAVYSSWLGRLPVFRDFTYVMSW